MTFNKDINEEDFGNFDFGFELIDGPPPDDEVQSTTQTTEELDQRFDSLENKMNLVLNLVSNIGDTRDDDSLSELISINDKLDRIMSMETNELSQAISDQGASIRAIIDEVEERKAQLDEQYKKKIRDVESLVLPLLINLTKNPEREYIKWPNRAQAVQAQIDRILQVTRADGD